MKLNIGIFYSYVTTPWGGINTFFRNFHQQAQGSRKIELQPDLDKADIILTAGHSRAPGKLIGQHHLRNLSRGRRLNHPLGLLGAAGTKKIVFRADGLRKIYAGKATAADNILIRNLRYSNAIVFQSRFSQACFEHLKVNYPPQHTIIFNGANSRVFRPAAGPNKIGPRIVCISNSWSTNTNKGFEVIARLSEINHIRMLHIGRWPESVASKRVELLGEMNEDQVADTLQRGHFFIFPSRYEACSNAVVEALASGLPILYHDSGGTRELCQDRTFGLPLPENETNSIALQRIIEEAVERFTLMRAALLDQHRQFSFKTCFDRYIEFFESVLN